jgi:hypothetical protein
MKEQLQLEGLLRSFGSQAVCQRLIQHLNTNSAPLAELASNTRVSGNYTITRRGSLVRKRKAIETANGMWIEK